MTSNEQKRKDSVCVCVEAMKFSEIHSVGLGETLSGNEVPEHLDGGEQEYKERNFNLGPNDTQQ